MYGLEPVPFNDGGVVASMDMSTEYRVIPVHQRGGDGARKWDDLGAGKRGRG
jgi:hypothetical protein